MFGVGGFFGQALGGYGGQWLYNRDKRFQCVLMGTSTLLAVRPPIFVSALLLLLFLLLLIMMFIIGRTFSVPFIHPIICSLLIYLFTSSIIYYLKYLLFIRLPFSLSPSLSPIPYQPYLKYYLFA